MNLALKVGQGFFPVGQQLLPLEEKNRQRPKQGQRAGGVGVAHGTAVLVLGSIPAMVLAVFDAPVAAGQFEQPLGIGLLWSEGAHGKAHVVAFLGHSALAHGLRVVVQAYDLLHSC